MSDELDERCARAMGLEIAHDDWPCGVPPDGCSSEAALQDDGDVAPWYNTHRAIYKARSPLDEWKAEMGLWCEPIPAYSTDHAAAELLEDEIDRRGRDVQIAYIKALGEIVPVHRSHLGGAVCYPVMGAWMLIRATPEQKARAFLATVPS